MTTERPISGHYGAGVAPVVSVVVPVHDGGDQLDEVLRAISASNVPRSTWELIVVDDASRDRSAAIAAGYANLVVRLAGRPRGPAYARNRGFEASRAPFVVFLDADVLVEPDALPRMIEAISGDASIGAIVGTYAAEHRAGRLLSDYRNLLRHVEHRMNTGETNVFSAGLAVVRRDVFERAGRFDEWRFPRPQAEALEFGDRLLALGYRILRRADVAAVHRKQWTIRQWIGVDLLDRGMSLARLNQFPDFRVRANRLQLSTPLDAGLAWSSFAAAAVAVERGDATWLLLSGACVLALVLHNLRLFQSLVRARTIVFGVACVPLHVITCAIRGLASWVGRLLFHTIGEPQPDPVTQAFAEVGMRVWPPVPVPPRNPDDGNARARSNAGSASQLARTKGS